MKKAGMILRSTLLAAGAILIAGTQWIWFSRLPVRVLVFMGILGACLGFMAGLISICMERQKPAEKMGRIALAISLLLTPFVFVVGNLILTIVLPVFTLIATFFLLNSTAHQTQRLQRMFLPLAISFIVLFLHSYTPWPGLRRLLAPWTYSY